jgi:hypothetical protein
MTEEFQEPEAEKFYLQGGELIRQVTFGMKCIIIL